MGATGGFPVVLVQYWLQKLKDPSVNACYVLFSEIQHQKGHFWRSLFSGFFLGLHFNLGHFEAQKFGLGPRTPILCSPLLFWDAPGCPHCVCCLSHRWMQIHYELWCRPPSQNLPLPVPAILQAPVKGTLHQHEHLQEVEEKEDSKRSGQSHFPLLMSDVSWPPRDVHLLPGSLA